MAVTLPTAAVVLAAAGSYIEENQAKQQAKGATNAANDQNALLQTQITDQQKATKQAQQANSNTGAATQQAAISALRAAMSSSTSMGGTVLSQPGQGGNASMAPTAGKTLLGQ